MHWFLSHVCILFVNGTIFNQTQTNNHNTFNVVTHITTQYKVLLPSKKYQLRIFSCNDFYALMPYITAKLNTSIRLFQSNYYNKIYDFSAQNRPFVVSHCVPSNEMRPRLVLLGGEKSFPPSFLKAFNTFIWISLINSLLAVSLIIFITNDTKSKHFRVNFYISELMKIIQSFISSVKVWKNIKNNAPFIMLFIWLLNAIVITKSLSGQIYAVLMQPNIEVIENVDQLTSIPSLTAYTGPGKNWFRMLHQELNHNSEKLEKFWIKLLKNLKYYHNGQNAFIKNNTEQLKSRKYIMLLDLYDATWAKRAHPQLRLHISKEKYWSSPSTRGCFVTNRRASNWVKKIFNRLYTRSLESGLSTSWELERQRFKYRLKNYVFDINREDVEHRDESIEQINIQLLISPIIAFGAGIIFSILLFILEIIICRIRFKNAPTTFKRTAKTKIKSKNCRYETISKIVSTKKELKLMDIIIEEIN